MCLRCCDLYYIILQTAWTSNECRRLVIWAKIVKPQSKIQNLDMKKRKVGFIQRLRKSDLLNVTRLHLMVEEISQRWSNVHGYIKSTLQRQVFRKINGHISMVLQEKRNACQFVSVICSF